MSGGNWIDEGGNAQAGAPDAPDAGGGFGAGGAGGEGASWGGDAPDGGGDLGSEGGGSDTGPPRLGDLMPQTAELFGLGDVELPADFPTGAAIDDGAASAVLGSLREAGYSNEQLGQIASAYMRHVPEMMRGITEREHATEQHLKSEWAGDFYDRFQNATDALIRTIGNEEEAMAFADLRLASGDLLGSHRLFIKVLDALARSSVRVLPDLPGGGGGGEGGGPGVTLAQARDMLADFNADPETLKILADSQHPRYQRTMERKRLLYELAHPNERAGHGNRKRVSW